MFHGSGVLFFQQVANPLLDAVARVFTYLGSQYFYMLILPFFYWCVDRRRGHQLAFLFLVSMWLNGLLKDLANMPRPSALFDGVQVLVRETSPGFPSGHAQGAMTLFGYLFLEYPARWWRVLAVTLIALIAFSRPYLGVHYLGDTLGGLAIGLLAVVAFRWGFRRGIGGRWPRRRKLILSLVVPVILLPLYTEGVAYQTLGFLMGFLAGDLYAFEAVPYRTPARLRAGAARLLLGLAGFAVLYGLHGTLIPNGLPELPGYALLGLWVTAGAPWLFRRLGLAEEPATAAPGAAARPVPAAGSEAPGAEARAGARLRGGVPAHTGPVRPLAGLAAGLLAAVVAGTVLAQPPVPRAAYGPMAGSSADRPQPLVIAHRGGDLRPENTLESFRHAASLGADWVEMDVHRIADGSLVILHDETVDRTTNGTGDVHSMTLAEVKALDAGYWWTPDQGRTYPYRGRGITIPTLQEVLEALPEQPLLIELKDDDLQLAADVARVLREYGATGRVMVASFHDRTLQYFRTLAPEVPTSLASGEALRFVVLQRLGLTPYHRPPGIALQVPEYHGTLKVFSSGLVRLAHDRGVEVHAWTVNDPRKMEQIFLAGVDGIVTDRPDWALQVRARLFGQGPGR
ncbi:glycerophosphoryl diester phosphodiesterase [Thermaerobacter marianensis DSM 12885]|uniref:Glycerophosphoryl diester phosphodiesterase n=1 Tax=Thermaerobacter marianensis (strain ATCC 700841 / DSM 12885 / JCM 10246 / 7p75a) TaxID=644966 RepID=E6SMM5_THEM7|nr:glycerophosphodiester phosphodiesterase family protein [Thermaerobacter marianensis]ADU51517.1 glycerophosphoryl diester phosphodiesterase [Thermaerobacter marianensis DSM 12885]